MQQLGDIFKGALPDVVMPEINSVAACDMRPFQSYPKKEDVQAFGFDLLPLSLLGIPVMLDPGVEVGVVELRNGDEVISRILIPELRA